MKRVWDEKKMSDMKKIMSGLFKAAVGTAVSNIGGDLKEKIEDKIEDIMEDIKGEKENRTPLEILSSRMTNGKCDTLTPMSEEEFRTRMDSIEYEVTEVSMSQISDLKIFTAKKGKNSITFKIYNEAKSAEWEYDMLSAGYKKEGRKILAEEEGTRILNQTANSYLLLSRIGNSLLFVLVPQENMEQGKVEIIHALQGTGY